MGTNVCMFIYEVPATAQLQHNLHANLGKCKRLKKFRIYNAQRPTFVFASVKHFIFFRKRRELHARDFEFSNSFVIRNGSVSCDSGTSNRVAQCIWRQHLFAFVAHLLNHKCYITRKTEKYLGKSKTGPSVKTTVCMSMGCM